MPTRWIHCILSLLCACASRTPSASEPSADLTPATASDTEPPPAPSGIEEPDEASDPRQEPRRASPPGTIAWVDLDRVLAKGPPWLLRELRPEAYRPHGRFAGWEITAVFPDAPDLCEPTCDLRTGDVIVAVEGDSLETPTAFATVFARAAALDSISVVRIRAGIRETVRYEILDRPASR